MIPSPDAVRRASEILERIERLQSELAGLFSGAKAPVAAKGRRAGKGAGKRRMSPEARERIARAARERWAKYRAAKKGAAAGSK